MANLQLDSDAAQLARTLLRAADELAELEPVNKRAGELIAAGPAPRRSGQLAASVRADATANGVVVGSALRYATFVHWGAPRRHVIAQPWLLDQTKAREADLIELYRDHAADVVADIGD